MLIITQSMLKRKHTIYKTNLMHTQTILRNLANSQQLVGQKISTENNLSLLQESKIISNNLEMKLMPLTAIFLTFFTVL